MSSRSMHSAAFILSLVGGIIILLGSIIEILILAFGSRYGAATVWSGNDGWHRFYGYGYDSGLFVGLSLGALFAGIIVVVGAFMLNARPVQLMT